MTANVHARIFVAGNACRGDQRAPERLLEGHRLIRFAKIDDDPEACGRIRQAAALVGYLIEAIGEGVDRVIGAIGGGDRQHEIGRRDLIGSCRRRHCR